MDLDPPPSTAPRKVKFAPKPPPRRTPKPVLAKIETAVEDDGDAEATRQIFSRRVDEYMKRQEKAKVEGKRAPVQVTFSHGVASSTIQSYSSKQKGKIDDKTSLTDDDLFVKKKKKYEEPWDYNTYCPITLPFRSPYSGNPELLDKAEFEDAPKYDENSVSSALDLGLLDEDDTTPRMLCFQFPPNLPLGNSWPSRSSKGKEIVGAYANQERRDPTKKGCNLEELPEGYMGKMLVYKSGAVKLKLGDHLYDVSPGCDCSFAQSVMAINTSKRQCCELGKLNKRAVVTPDIDSLMDNMTDFG